MRRCRVFSLGLFAVCLSHAQTRMPEPLPSQVTLTSGERCCAPDSSETTPTLATNSEIEEHVESLLPHPYLLFGPALGGGGYRALALLFEGGIDLESHLWHMNASAAYDNDRKTDDGDQPNPKGHDRYLQGNINFRPFGRRWFFGAGYRWNQLSTTNYAKAGNRPQFGGGYDFVTRPCSSCRRDFSMRLGLTYFTAGDDWQNGSHGVEIEMMMPTPREKRHWFYRQRMLVYRFHETVTEVNDPALTEQQRADKGFDASADFGILYRF